MTEVSWRRILQNAGAEFPDDEQMRPSPYSEMPRARDPGNTRSYRGSPQPQRYQQPQPYQQQPRGLSDLEMELQRALKRTAARNEARPAPAPVRRRESAYASEPVYAPERAERPPVERRRAQLPVLYAPPVPIRPKAEPKRRKGGLRNLIAISLSAAVVGFAAHEVSMQWKRSHAVLTRHGPTAAIDPAVTGTVNGKQAALAFQPIPSGDNEQAATEEPTQTLPANTRLAAYAPPSSIGSDARGATTAAVEPGKIRPVPANEEQTLMQRAMAHLEHGDIASARLFLQHLASRNSALAAISLAKTYDARYIAAFNIKGLKAEPEMARKWYKRAAELGSREAVAYLNNAR